MVKSLSFTPLALSKTLLLAVMTLILSACSNIRMSERESTPATFAEIANRFVGRGDEGFSASWCPGFMQALKAGAIPFISPALETDDGTAPELSKYNDCKNQQFWDPEAGGWSPASRYVRSGHWDAGAQISTSDILIIPWNLRYRSVVPDIGHRNFKLYRLPNLKKEGGDEIEVIYGDVDRELDKANSNYLRLISPGKRLASGYWMIDTKQCYAKWRDVWVGHSELEKHSHHAIVRYNNEYYVLKIYPSDASPWAIGLELIAYPKVRMTEWWPCKWSGDIKNKRGSEINQRKKPKGRDEFIFHAALKGSETNCLNAKPMP